MTSRVKTIAGVTVVLCGVVQAWGEHSVLNVEPSARVLTETNAEVRISMESTKPTRARMFVYDADLNLLAQEADLNYGVKHEFTWQATDEDGAMRAPGMCFYRFETEDESGYKLAYDELLASGARDAPIYWPKWDRAEKTIRFNLQRDSLVRVRVGIPDGPMIATPADWTPVYARSPSVAWDGRDANGAEDYSEETNLQFHVEAISLPGNYICVQGPAGTPPPSHIQGKWIQNILAVKAAVEPREYRIASSVVGLPEESTAVRLECDKELEPDGTLLLDRKVNVTVHVPEFDEEQRANQTYEVVYFVNRYMVFEEPLAMASESYELDPAKVEKGGSIFIANVILGSARVGTASLKLMVP